MLWILLTALKRFHILGVHRNKWVKVRISGWLFRLIRHKMHGSESPQMVCGNSPVILISFCRRRRDIIIIVDIIDLLNYWPSVWKLHGIRINTLSFFNNLPLWRGIGRLNGLRRCIRHLFWYLVSISVVFTVKHDLLNKFWLYQLGSRPFSLRQLWRNCSFYRGLDTLRFLKLGCWLKVNRPSRNIHFEDFWLIIFLILYFFSFNFQIDVFLVLKRTVLILSFGWFFMIFLTIIISIEGKVEMGLIFMLGFGRFNFL